MIFEMLVTILLLGIALEVGVYVWPLALGRWVRKAFAVGAMISVGMATGALLSSSFNAFTALFAFVTLYRMVNLLRIVQSRLPEKYLWRACSRTSVMLIGGQTALLAIWYIAGPTVDMLWYVAVVAQLLGAIGIAASTVRSVIKTTYSQGMIYYSDKELPTVTIAIPARNETEDLEDCLRAALASDYPKLEILVLDDCSQDGTPEIIRAFAHDGVRFVPGEEPKTGWLAKNQAYARLYEHATGQYLLFCGVDVRLGSQAVRSLVTATLRRDKRMVSVLPMRAESRYQDALVQPARYWWELALPRRLFNRSPVLSSCWLIDKKAIKKAGGFAAVSRSITPEAYFARELIKDDDYSFMRSSADLDVRTIKSFEKQVATAIRTGYPRLRRQPENVMALTIGEITLLLGPFISALSIVWTPPGAAHLLAVASCFLLAGTHSLIIRVTDPSNRWLSLVGLPAVIIAELVINHISMWKYEFSEVRWKGRNVCAAVMQAVPRLPKV